MITAAIVGSIITLARDGLDNMGKLASQIRGMKSQPMNKTYHRAASKVFQLYESLSTTYPSLQREADPSDIVFVLKILAKHFKVTFKVHSLKNGEDFVQRDHVISYSAGDNLSRPIVHLFLHDEHVSFIDSLESYFRNFGRFCTSCRHLFKTPYHRRCGNQIKTCIKCFRPVQDNIEDICDSLLKVYCTSSDEIVDMKCDSCFFHFDRKQCYSRHKLYACQKRIVCEKCSFVVFLNSQNTKTSALQNHSCKKSFKNCTKCHEPLSDDHICQMKPRKLWPFYPKLIMLDMLVENPDPNGSPCLACVNNDCIVHSGANSIEALPEEYVHFIHYLREVEVFGKYENIFHENGKEPLTFDEIEQGYGPVCGKKTNENVKGPFNKSPRKSNVIKPSNLAFLHF